MPSCKLLFRVNLPHSSPHSEVVNRRLSPGAADDGGAIVTTWSEYSSWMGVGAGDPGELWLLLRLSPYAAAKMTRT